LDLEDEAMKAIPKLLKQDFGVEGYITPTNYNPEFA